MKQLIFIIFVSLLSFSAFSASNPILPNAGGTGISNNNANTLTLGGIVDITGAFTGIPADDSDVVHLTGDETIAGIKTFLSSIVASITGNAATVTNGIYSTDTGTVTNTMLSGSIADSKLSTISTSGKVSNSATTAASANTASAIVTRDGSGNFSAGTITAALSGNATTATTASTVTTNANMTGDITSIGNATTLATVNSNVGGFGDGTHVGAFTVNAKGLVTAASSVAITGAVPTGAAGGDLGNTFPNPSVLKINGVTLGNTTATSGNLLIGSGTQWVTEPISGDGTLSSLGAINITKTGGVAFATSATTDTTNAANISSGILPSARLSGNYLSAISGQANSVLTATTSGNAVFYPLFVNSNSAAGQVPFVNGSLSYNPSTGTLTATTFSGALSGNATSATTASGVTGGYVSSITGTTNEVIASGATGAVTLSLPQSIATTSTPIFGGETINGGNSALSVGNSALSGTNAALLMSGSLAEGNYINFGAGGRNQGIFHNGALFISANLNYDQSISGGGYRYSASNGGSSIMFGNTLGTNFGIGSLQHAASGTAGNQATMVTDLTWSSSGINVPSLSASSLVATDSSDNLSSSTSGLNAQLTRLGLGGAPSSYAITLIPTSGQSLIEFADSGATNHWQLLAQGTSNGDLGFTEAGVSSNRLVIGAGGHIGINVATPSGALDVSGGDVTDETGNLIINTAGKGLKIKQGTNGCSGTGAVMVAGAVTVSTNCAVTGSVINIMRTASGGTSVAGLPVITISSGSSFTITGGIADTSTWSWVIFPPA